MEYIANTSNNTIYSEFTGFIDATSLIKDIQMLRSDRYFQEGFNVILDFRKAYVPKGYTELAKVAEFVRVTSVAAETFKLAILVKHPEQLSSANLYALLVRKDHLLVCESEKEAEDWVTR